MLPTTGIPFALRFTAPVAIIGLACRLPGAADLDAFWQTVVEGRCAIGDVPGDRLDRTAYHDPRPGVRGRTSCTRGGLLDVRLRRVDDAVLPADVRDAADPSHARMAAVACDALRDAGLDPFDLPDRNVAVFVGQAQGSGLLEDLAFAAQVDEVLEVLAGGAEFARLDGRRRAAIRQRLSDVLRPADDAPARSPRRLGCDLVAGTIARALGTTGPWASLNSACTASLHALLFGMRALQNGRAGLAIVGGAAEFRTDTLVQFSQAQATGSSVPRTFDADADGVILGEGCVAAVLKPLDRALADGDVVQAVVAGVGVSTEGRGKSLWAPASEGQVRALRRAYRHGLDPESVQYVECHATGTPVGDAVELQTLAAVFGQRADGPPLPIGSVKANIGHLLEAAGLAGVAKSVLALRRRTIPPAIAVQNPTRRFDWQSAPFDVPTRPRDWPAPQDGGPRRAAVDAFAIGGMSLHVVLEEAPSRGSASAPSSATATRTTSATDAGAVAIVGLGCRLPGAPSVDAFRELLAGERDPRTRRVDPVTGKVQLVGQLDPFEFDWRRHRVPPKQVATADPLQFLLVDAAEQALADYGADRWQPLRETCGTIVASAALGDFAAELEPANRLPAVCRTLRRILAGSDTDTATAERIEAEFATAAEERWPGLEDETGSFQSSTRATRIARTFDLGGGAVVVDGGATSSATALTTAVEALLAGDMDLVVCAAGQRFTGRFACESLARDGLLTRAGVPRHPLDAEFDGIVPADGVGAVVLRRLDDAVRDGDPIRAVIRGFGAAHHASSALALRAAAKRSLAAADVDAAQIAFTEFATDESLDRTGCEMCELAGEIDAPDGCTARSGRRGPLLVDSVASRLGHAGSAAGLAGLIRLCLALDGGRPGPAFGLERPAAWVGRWADVRPTRATDVLEPGGLGALACWSLGQAVHVVVEGPRDSDAHGAPGLHRSG